VKEPARGSLGPADPSVIRDVLHAVAGRAPVSAALGELLDTPTDLAPSELSFVKWGLSGCQRKDWRRALLRAHRPGPCRPVAVAYADWSRAIAPAPAEVCDFAIAHSWGAFLLDTWRKDGSTLLDWLSFPALAEIRTRCQHAGVPVALAGSLGEAEIRDLLVLQPDWFAVRGSVCRSGRRTNSIDASRVRSLADLLTATPAG
jgi:(5-formylfuran-3-yl)methyl phosphate synthase